MLKKNLFLFIFLVLLFVNIPLAYGAGIIPEATGSAAPSGCSDRAAEYGANAKTYCGNYAVNDFITLAINVARWILGIVGSLSLAMFIYGGFMFLISAGSADSVGKAKQIITAAVIGLIIVFSSYLIIKFTLDSMGVNWSVVNGVKWTNTQVQIISK